MKGGSDSRRSKPLAHADAGFLASNTIITARGCGATAAVHGGIPETVFEIMHALHRVVDSTQTLRKSLKKRAIAQDQKCFLGYVAGARLDYHSV
jgi:hypothetical protein